MMPATARPGMPAPDITYLALALFALYPLSIWGGTWMIGHTSFTNIIWFTPGIGIVILLLLGNRALPLIFLLSALAHGLDGRLFGGEVVSQPVTYGTSWGILDCLEVWLACSGIPTGRAQACPLENRQDLLYFLWRVAMLPALVVSAIEVFLIDSYFLGGAIPQGPDQFLVKLIEDSSDDILGIIAIVPMCGAVQTLGLREALLLGARVLGLLLLPIFPIFFTAGTSSVVPASFLLIAIVIWIAAHYLLNGSAWMFLVLSLASLSFSVSTAGHQLITYYHLTYAHFFFVVVSIGLLSHYIALTVTELQVLNRGLEDRIAQRTCELTEANDRLKEIAFLDGLTGLANRRAFTSRIESEHACSQRTKRPYAIAMVDVDHFKKVNDQYGHQSGDLVLATLASILQTQVRSMDLAARWGGEEFIILFPETTADIASIAMERIRATLASQPIPVQDQAILVTISIGITNFCIRDKRVEDVFARADEALYAAKSGGRNRVVLDSSVSGIVPTCFQLAWNPGYASGCNLIDEQHMRLLEDINKLLIAIKDNNPSLQLAALAEEFIGEMNSHFHDEEEMLQKIGYPDLNQHRHIHQALQRKSKSLLEKFRRSEIGGEALFEFMGHTVFAEHILNVDTHYFPLLRRNLQNINSPLLEGVKSVGMAACAAVYIPKDPG